MEHDQENIVYTLEGSKFIVKVPERSGKILGIIRYRDSIIIACEYGDIWLYDLDRHTLSRLDAI